MPASSRTPTESRLFPVHTLASAPERSKAALAQLASSFGMVPNLVGAIANAPVLIESLVGLFGKVHGGSFSEAEVQVVLLTDAVTNRSAWPVAFHTTLALKEGVPPEDVEAIRDGQLPKDGRFRAVSGLARSLIDKRGHLDRSDVDAFLAAGFERAQLLELVAAVAASTITNYAASITQPSLDEPFAAHAWHPDDAHGPARLQVAQEGA